MHGEDRLSRLCEQRIQEGPEVFGAFELAMKALKDELEKIEARLKSIATEVGAVPAKQSPDSDYRQDITKAQREIKKTLTHAARDIRTSYDHLKMIQTRSGNIVRGEY